MSETKSYLFGDSTPFPHAANFLETIGAATRTCAALLNMDAEIDRCQHAIEEAKSVAIRETAELAAIDHAVSSALASLPATQPDLPVYDATANELRDAWPRSYEQANQKVTRIRDGAIQRAEQAIAAIDVLHHLESLLVQHELPETTWRSHWRATAEESAEARAEAITPFGLRANLAVAIPTGSAWTAAQRVGALKERSLIHVLRPRRLFGGAKLVAVNLDKYWLADVLVDASRSMFQVRKSFKQGMQGFEFWVPETGPIQFRALDEEGATPEPMDADDGRCMRSLWEQIRPSVVALVRDRQKLIGGTFDQLSLTDLSRPDLARPGLLAEALIAALAPLVRDIKARSGSPGELTLKEVQGDGSRKELFISEQSLIDHFIDLPAPQRETFVAFGIGMDSTLQSGSEDTSAVLPSDPDGPSEAVSSDADRTLQLPPPTMEFADPKDVVTIPHNDHLARTLLDAPSSVESSPGTKKG